MQTKKQRPRSDRAQAALDKKKETGPQSTQRDLMYIQRRKEENAFINEQVDMLHATGVTAIIEKYGTDDVDKIDRMWFKVLGKMVDGYMTS
jgi:hypothetical protein